MNKINLIILYLYVFTVPFQQSFIIPSVGSLNKIIGILLVITTILTVLINKKIKKLPLTFLTLYLFLFINLLSIFWSVSIESGLDTIVLYAQLIFTFWVIYEFVDSKSKLTILLKAFVLGCTVLALEGSYTYFISSDIVSSTTRFSMDGYNPNYLGIIWSFGMVISIYLLLNESKLYSLYIPLSLFLFFLTGSRTALILVLLILFGSFVYMYLYKVKYRKTITVLFVAMIGLLYTFIPSAQLERLATIESQIADRDLNGRVAIWESGMRAFADNPALGVGIGSFKEVSARFSFYGMEMSSHNSYLTILVETGIVGFTIFFAFLTILLYYAWKSNNDKNLRWLSLILIILWLTLSLASHAEAQKYTWIIFGVIVSIYFIDSKFDKYNEKELLALDIG